MTGLSSYANMASGGGGSPRREDGQVLRHLVQTLRSDLNLLSNEARKKYPAVREAAERGAMRLKSISESKGFSLQVLAETDDVVHPLLFACETKNPHIVQISLSSLQKLIQYKATPQKSVESIVATLRVLMESSVEELKIIQTILLLVTSTDVVQGKSLAKVLMLCFKLYNSRDASVHNTAGVAIRQVVSAMFERLNTHMKEEEEGEDEDVGKGGKGSGSETHKQLPTQARDAYLLFQDICFLTNGDPPAWLPTALEMELSLGLELLETVLRGYPHVFVGDKLFNQLLTERVCPLVVKLFSPTTKYRHSPTPGTLVPSDKPTFALSIRLLRILSVLIREFYFSLVTQCEIFLSMLVRFLDSDKPLWQRTLAVEVLHSFCNQPLLLKSFCENYDMQEHSSKIFGDIISAMGGFIQSNLAILSPVVQLPFGQSFGIASSPSVTNNSNTSHVTSSVSSGERHMHFFSIRSINLQVEALPPNTHNKPTYLEMLDKVDTPVISDGYPLVVAMNALLDAIKSISLVINGEVTKATPTLSSEVMPTPEVTGDVRAVMLSSSWTGVLAALSLLLDACVDEHTTTMILGAHQSFIQLCGSLGMTAPRDAFLTSLCKACLPPKHAMNLIAQRGGRTSSVAHYEGTESGGEGRQLSRLSESGAKKRLNFSEGVTGGGGVGSEGVGRGSGGGSTPVLHRAAGSGTLPIGGTPGREQPSGLVTVKNIQCVETLLQIIDHHGNILDSAWLLVMTTVQHIFEVFGLKALSTGGFQQPSGFTENPSLALVSVDKKMEITEIADKLANLFKSTQRLSDQSLLYLIKSLCRLSSNTMAGRDGSLFPIASLLETGTSNLGRVTVIWGPITKHLIQVCSHGDLTVRLFGTDSLSHLIRSALEQETQEDVQLMLLSPLESLTAVQHVDVRQKQLECLSHVLLSSGQTLQSSWSIMLDVISSVTKLQSESLIRTGFQSLQLLVTDFLLVIPPPCMPLCVEVTSQYGLQTIDINISLTSIGLLWNIADYLFQNRATLHDALEALRSHEGQTSQTSQTDSTKPLLSAFVKNLQSTSLPVFDSVWMLLFRRLSDLCVDDRAAVRKSASQTLFSTISAHGTLLQRETWQGVLWQVLFPLLERVSHATGSASTSSFQTSLLIHHSRDTAQKQWAETQVLTLEGVARLFQSRWMTLARLDGFPRAWTTLLEAIKRCACSSNSEVSIAAVKSFHSIVDPKSVRTLSPRSSTISPSPRAVSPSPRAVSPSPQDAKTSPPRGPLVERLSPERTFLSALSSSLDPSAAAVLTPEQSVVVWTKAWQAWQSIGVECICSRLPTVERLKSILKQQKMEEVEKFFHSFPSQTFLAHLLKIFPLVFVRLKPKFSQKDFRMAAKVFQACLLLPTSKDTSPFLVPSSSENLMTAVQKLVLKCFGVIFTEENVFEGEDEEASKTMMIFNKKSEFVDMKREIAISTDTELVMLYPQVLEDLLTCSSFASKPPELIRLIQGSGATKLPMMVVNHVPFGLASLSVALQLYRACVAADVSLPLQVSEDFLKALHHPLKLKHHCSSPLIWTQSVEVLLLLLETSLPGVLKQESNSPFWQELAELLDDFLFNTIPDGVEISAERMREYEALDIKVIEVIKRDILSASTQVPHDFLETLTSILNRGSIHSAADQLEGTAPSPRVPFRENFARVCFEALLQFSFIHSQESSIDTTSQLALNALLQRCEEVLRKFVSDERLSGSCPLPRTRLNEVALILKSVTVLISALRETQKSSSAKLDPGIWQHVARLYPALVQCVTCSSVEVRTALREALLQFSDLIHP